MQGLRHQVVDALRTYVLHRNRFQWERFDGGKPRGERVAFFDVVVSVAACEEHGADLACAG